MGFLGGIGKAIGGIVKQVAPSIIKAVAPAATKLLQGIVGDTFKAGGALLNKLAGNLPGPLAGLAQKLLGKFMPKLQQMANGGVESLIKKLAESITKRFAPGVGNVSIPGTNTQPRLDAIANNPATPPAPSTGSSGSAATGSSSSAATTSGNSVATGSSSGAATSSAGVTAGAAGDYDKPPAMPGTGASVQDWEKYQAHMAEFTRRMNAMQNHWQAITNIVKSNADTQKAILSNLR